MDAKTKKEIARKNTRSASAIFTWKLTTKIFVCGAIRANIARDKFTRNVDTKIGAETFKAIKVVIVKNFPNSVIVVEVKNPELIGILA